jgi:hypothetical protein
MKDKNKISMKIKASGPVAKQIAPMAKKMAGSMSDKVNKVKVKVK